MVLRSADVISTVSSFEDLYLEPKLCRALAAAGFDTPSPVQEAALPACLTGADVVVQATSGTGKTVVISCTCLSQAMQSAAPARSVKALVVVPTRELAVQIQDTTIAIGRHYCPEIACHSLIGGLSFDDDRRKLNMRADVVVGTPGRLITMIRSKHLILDSVSVFVLDEADRLLDSSLCSQSAEIYEALPRRKQVVALSATFGETAVAHVLPMMKRPRRFDVRDTGNSAPAAVRHLYACTEASATNNPRGTLSQVLEEKWKLLTRLMHTIMFNQALLFCNSPAAAPALAARLRALGIPSTYISARLPQPERLAALRALRSLSVRVAVTSDVLARGIDLEYINLVINFDLPHDCATYAHRLGRAGRFGTSALAVTLVTPSQVATAKGFAAAAGCGSLQEVPAVIPEDWYYRQAEGSAAESLEQLAMPQNRCSAESEAQAAQMYPLSGRFTGYHSSKPAVDSARGWQGDLCGGGNHDRQRAMFDSGAEAERWFADLDQKHADIAAARPVLNMLQDDEGIDAWEAFSAFSVSEMQWLLQCSNPGVVCSAETQPPWGSQAQEGGSSAG